MVFEGNSSAQSSHDQLPTGAFPDNFDWCNKDGVNYCTASLNQHIPQYCGSCWAHGAISALQDRIKMDRIMANATGDDVQLSVQHVLNCGNAGSCHGGSHHATYEWIQTIGDETGSGVSYFTGQPYMACSKDSDEGLCPSADWTCNALNVARTCGTFGQECVGLSQYPNATLSEHGSITGADAMMKEIYNRGPIACTIAADDIRDYESGIASGGGWTDHVVSVVGWGTDAQEGLYWIVRNSWGEYWGEAGFVRVKSGALSLEESCVWATPGVFTAPEFDNQYHCHENGNNCGGSEKLVV